MIKFVDTSKKEQDELQSKEIADKRRQVLNDLNLRLSFQIESLIEKLGVDLGDYVSCDDFIRGPALCHNGDNPTGFIYYRQSGYWKCWTQQCHENYYGNIIGLIRATLDLSYVDAFKWASDFVDNKIDIAEIKELHEKRENARKKTKTNYWKDHNEPKQVFSEETLKNLNSAAKFAQQRKLDPALFDSYGIGYAWRGPLSKRIVIPVRNVRGQLIGFSGRKLIMQEDDIKWFHWPSGDPYGKFRTSIHLFNVDRAFKHNISNSQSEYILTEGPLDVIKMEMAGIHNSVCTFGNGISDGQIEVLRQIGATKILIAYDGDEPGDKGANIVLKKLEKKLFASGIIRLTSVYPDWDSDKLGGLDWANQNLDIDSIRDLVEKHNGK